MTAQNVSGCGTPFGTERRTGVRQRVLKGATLAFNKGYGALEGVVRNESTRGALLHLGDTAAVPGTFSLTVKGAEARMARVKWRDPLRVGVEFTD